jgi:squalene monooxygenase
MAMAEAAGVGGGGAAVAAATLLTAVFLAAVFRYKQRRRGVPTDRTPAPVVPDREGSAAVDGLTDVIIVGAGVAGSALAYTLGKVVYLFLPLSFLPVLPFRWLGRKFSFFP